MLIIMRDFSLTVSTEYSDIAECEIKECNGTIISKFGKENNITSYHLLMSEDKFYEFKKFFSESHSILATIVL